MSYTYQYDSRVYGDVLVHREAMEQVLKGLLLLRERLDAWNKDESTLPYAREVKDLDWMIKWSRDRLARTGRLIDFNSISVGSLRYLKAGEVLMVLEAEEQLRRDLNTLPAGVIAARRASIATMKEGCEEGVFASLDPADCLWEVAPMVSIRTPAPAVLADGSQPWDVFISHASEDKEPFVISLAKALRDSGVRVWLDDFVLQLGDSLRRSIERGLRASRYGVVVLSPRFFEKEWPQKELDGMAALEVDGRKVILPIWHEVGVAEVRAYSPILADRVAITSDQGLGAVVKRILDVVQPRTRATQTLPEFAAGRWRSMGESNELVIESDLTWRWTSTWQGRWRGNGRGEVRGVNLVLVGSRDGFDSVGNPYPNHRTEITLERHDDRLEGSIQTMFRTEVKFVRDESARAEW